MEDLPEEVVGRVGVRRAGIAYPVKIRDHVVNRGMVEDLLTLL